MNWKTWTPLAVAVVLGLAAAKVASDTVARNRGAARAEGNTIKVVVAKGPVSPGQELTADLLTLGPISAAATPAGAFTDPAAIVGRVTATALFEGQPVMATLLTPAGTAAGLAALVPNGMRALTVEVNETSGVAGMILPGSRVDVVCTLNGASRHETIACTIVQDVLVQAVGQRMTAARNTDEKEPAPVRSVTLIATPRDAEAIELASSTGRTRLVLRGANDRALSESSGVSFVDLVGEDWIEPPPMIVPPPVAVVPVAATQPVTTVATTQPATDPFAEPARLRRTVTLIKGGSRTEVTFELPGKAEVSKLGDIVTSTNEGGQP